MPINEASKALMDKAYDGSAETAFVIYLGKEIVSVAQTPADEALLDNLLKRLVTPKIAEQFSPEVSTGFRTLQNLLVATVEAQKNPDRYRQGDQPN